jgi:hypothetical protein
MGVHSSRAPPSPDSIPQCTLRQFARRQEEASRKAVEEAYPQPATRMASEALKERYTRRAGEAAAIMLEFKANELSLLHATDRRRWALALEHYYGDMANNTGMAHDIAVQRYLAPLHPFDGIEGLRK